MRRVSGYGLGCVLLVVALVADERLQERPTLLTRAQRAVDEQVGDHWTARWLPTDGGCSNCLCRGVQPFVNSAGHTSCDHAELPGEYLYNNVRRCRGPCQPAVPCVSASVKITTSPACSGTSIAISAANRDGVGKLAL